MRLCGFMSCRRILLSVLRDKVSQGTERLSWVPLSTSPPFRFLSTRPKRNGGQVMTTINLKDFYYWYIQDQFIARGVVHGDKPKITATSLPPTVYSISPLGPCALHSSHRVLDIPVQSHRILGAAITTSPPGHSHSHAI